MRALHWIERLTAAGLFDADAVRVHGPGFPGGPIGVEDSVLLLRNARRLTRGRGEARLLARARPGVYDLDDGLPWDDGKLPGLGHWSKRPFPRSLLATRAASAADRVIAGNEVLAEWAGRHCRDVRMIPTCVEPADYDVRSSWELPEQSVIGWIGSPATEPYLLDVIAALAEVCRRSNARVDVVSGPRPTALDTYDFVSREPWTAGIERRIASWDIGIMPLRDGVYERAKCGFKLLQYAASGVPAIGSPVGVNADFLHRMDAAAPTTLDEWASALEAMLQESASRRGERARAGLQMVTSYSYEHWQSAWVDAVGW